MAFVTQVSIGTSQKVSVDYQSQEVSVSVTYSLEREDTDLLAFVSEKTTEVERAHAAIRQRIKEMRAERNGQQATEAAAPAPPPALPEGEATRNNGTPAEPSAAAPQSTGGWPGRHPGGLTTPPRSADR